MINLVKCCMVSYMKYDARMFVNSKSCGAPKIKFRSAACLANTYSESNGSILFPRVRVLLQNLAPACTFKS